jgi:hypothetical protein
MKLGLVATWGDSVRGERLLPAFVSCFCQARKEFHQSRRLRCVGGRCAPLVVIGESAVREQMKVLCVPLKLPEDAVNLEETRMVCDRSWS